MIVNYLFFLTPHILSCILASKSETTPSIMSESKSSVSSQLDYSSSSCMEPLYSMRKITAREGAGSVTITTSGGQESFFDLPARAMNLSKTVLSFTATVPGTADRYNKMHMDCMSFIRQVQLFTANGVRLCDIDHVGNHTKVLWKPETKLEDLLSMPNHGPGTGPGSMLQKCNKSSLFKPVSDATRLAALETDPAGVAIAAHTAVATAGGNTYADAALNGALTDVEGKINAAVQANVQQYQDILQAWIGQPPTEVRRNDDALIAAETGASSYVDVDYKEPKYFVSGTVGGDTVIKVKFPLGLLYDTIFELDKTIDFAEILQLRIVWNPSTKIYFFHSDPLSVAGGANMTAADNSVVISSLRMFVAQELRPEVIQGLRSKISSGGMSLTIPYTYSWKTALFSERQNITLKFNRAHGKRLQRIYHTLFQKNETKNTCYDHDSRGARKATTFYTTLDGHRLQEFNIDCSEEEDYMLMKSKLQGSAVMNADIYKYNWVWCDDFTGDKPLWQKDWGSVCGLDLGEERTWEFVGDAITVNAAPDALDSYNHYTFAVCQRDLRITSSGLDLS